MAAPLRKTRQEEVRRKIQCTKLIQRLEANAEGKLELTTVQQKSIEILLKKSLPDLSSIEISGDVDNPIITRLIIGS